MILTEKHIRKCANNLLMGVYSGDRYQIKTSLNQDAFTIYIRDKENDFEIMLISNIDGRDFLHPIYRVTAATTNKQKSYVYNDRPEDNLLKDPVLQDKVLYDTLRAWTLQRIRDEFTIIDEKAIDAFKLSE